ncbi:MAG: zinc-dependent alcohol dehydrogenase family protein [Propionicimonas sp.]|nr:zinc-dependent alcohol dehydrogenase family protein [Propionicimonas sp.]MEA5118906.1 zinc-dependent alcohol dehydrogenase family protein [Propionicimonas sp.]
MRAVSYPAYGAPPRLVELPEPECPPDGAVVAVRATGVCRSDWHAWRGHDPIPLPMVPGHEFAGVVARVGERVTGFATGDRVTAPFVNGCGRCIWCRTGQAQVCPNQTQPGFTHPGSFADLVVVRAADFNLVRLPTGIDFVTAAALGCRFATSYHALTAQSRPTAGEWLLVVGCGGVGLSAVMVGRALGARVLAVDPSKAARARAAELGAEVLPAADPAAIRELTEGGVQVSLDAVGSATTAAAAVRSLRRRGRHVQVGLMLGDNADAPLPWGEIVAQELEVVGSHGMAAADYPGLLELIVRGRLDPARLVGRVVDLGRAGEELMALDRPAPAAAGIVVIRVGQE